MKADPLAIERHLRQIQQEMTPGEAKASLFNLVVMVGQGDDRPLVETLNTLHGKRPARVIVVRPTQGQETQVDVTARCVSDGEDKDLCIQEIAIYSAQDGSGEAAETWSPLVIREIPVFVWWLGDPEAPHQGRRIPEVFDETADRCVVNSSLTPQPLEFYQRLARGEKAVYDLAWDRISPLLKVTAHFFNPPTMGPRLHNLRSVKLRGADRAEALLFFGWMKEKMGWTGRFDQGSTWNLGSSGGNISLTHEPGPLEGFELSFEDREGERFTLEDSREGYAQGVLAGGERFSEVFHVPTPAESLLRLLDSQALDRLYQETLAGM